MKAHCMAFALALVAFPAHTEPAFPVSVPQECMELAQREGVPTVISSRYEATKARIKLARLPDSDPLVQECRAAVARAKTAMRATN